MYVDVNACNWAQIVSKYSLWYTKSLIYKSENLEIFLNQESCNYFPHSEPVFDPSFVTCLEWGEVVAWFLIYKYFKISPLVY